MEVNTKKVESNKLSSFTAQFSKKNYIILLQYLIVSFGITLLMEILSRKSISGLFSFVIGNSGGFIYNVLLIYFTLCFSLFFDKRRFWLALIAGLWIGICVANTILMQYRSMPLTAQDILLMSSVRDIFEIYLSPIALIGLMFMISVLGATIVYIWISVQKRGWIPFFALVHVSALLLVLVCVNNTFTKMEIVDEKDEFYNLAQAYEDNGFAYCFSASFLTKGVEEPEDYSYYDVNKIIQDQKKNSPNTAEDTPNLIFVQLESFFDPYYMKGLTYAYDPIPNFRYLKENYSHGFLSVPCIGAGTANTEFEVLTGMNLSHFGVGEYPYTTIVDSGRTDSIPWELLDLGYDTHALHNNNATFYNRHIVYDNLGFLTFTPVEYMTEVSYNVLGWAKDSCLTSEILKCLTEDEKKDFIYAVSVEPHGRYPKNPIEEASVIPVTGIDESRKNGFEYYLYALSQSDIFIRELTDALSQISEPTMVVFFGDHLPSFNIQDDELSAGTCQTTEYVIWANYSTVKKEQDLQSYQLGAYVMEQAGIYEGPLFRHHQCYNYTSEESGKYQEDLQSLEYDIIYGEGYTLKSDPLCQKEPMVLGVSPVLLEHLIYNDEESFYVVGKNFTPFSVLYIDDVACTTTYVSSEKLLVEEPIPNEAEKIVVAQVSAVDPLSILSESNHKGIDTG